MGYSFFIRCKSFAASSRTNTIFGSIIKRAGGKNSSNRSTAYLIHEANHRFHL